MSRIREYVCDLMLTLENLLSTSIVGLDLRHAEEIACPEGVGRDFLWH